MLERADDSEALACSRDPVAFPAQEREEVLALEAERYRLEQRMSELAGELNEGNQELKTKELAQVSDRLSSNASILTALREILTQLRARSSALRSNAP